jgi:hypothetical protein
MKLTLSAMILVLSSLNCVDAQTYVKPYMRKNGTFIEGHYRSRPNSSLYDNFSTRGNVNPYTGQRGTVSPYGTDGGLRQMNRNMGNRLYNPYGR